MTGALSAHYARALADSVFAPRSTLKPEDAVTQLRNVQSFVSGSKELQMALLSPAVNKQRKIAILGKFCDQLGVDRAIRNFLSVVVMHRRTNELKAILQSFEAEVDERLGWVHADITSAHELNAGEREEVERTLGTKLGKFIRARYQVDPALLAGVRAHVASKEYDATLRGKLESMRLRLNASY